MISFEKCSAIFPGKYTYDYNQDKRKYFLIFVPYADCFLEPFLLDSYGVFDTEDEAIHKLFELAKAHKWSRLE